MSSAEQLLQQFTQVFSGISTEAIQNAEQRLLEIEKQSSFLADCLAILNEQQVQYNIKKLVTVYFSKYAKRVAKLKNPNKSIELVHFFLSLIQSNSISHDLKPEIRLALETFINLESNRPLKLELSNKIASQLQGSLQLTDQNINFTYLIFVGQAIIGNFSYSDQTKDFIKATFKQYIILTQKLVNKAQTFTTESKQSKQYLFLISKLLKEYSQLLKHYFKRMGVLDIDGTKLLYLQELQQLITSAIALNIKGNTFSNSLYILIANEIQISKQMNTFKCNILAIMNCFNNMLKLFVKHANLLNSNPLFVKMPQMLEYFFKSTATILETTAYYNLPIKSGLLESIDAVFTFLIGCLRMNDFYPVFNQYKSELIDKVILPCLALTPKQASFFYEEPEQFIQFSLQIVERDLKSSAKRLMEAQNQDEEIKQYETLKTYAADFLSSLCQFQDGTLTQVFQHAIGVIQNTVKSVYSKSTMFMVIACLKIHLRERKDLKLKLAKLFKILIETLPLPVVDENNKKEADIQYAYILLVMSKLVIILKQTYSDIVQVAFKLGFAVLQSNTTNDVHKSFVLDLFTQLMKIDEGQKHVFNIVNIYNHLLANSKELSIHLLDAYFELIKYNADVLKKQPESLLNGLKLVSQHIELQVQKTAPVQLTINKCWNIIREVGEDRQFLPDLIPHLEEIVLPLVPYIDGVRNLDFQEDILLLITSFVDKGKKVTVNQQKMFEIVPKIFYGQYCCRFGQAFHTIQLFIYYGSDVLRNSFNAIEAIVRMALTSITQTEYKKKPIGQCENCEGVLILQSLIVKCGDLFTHEMWKQIFKSIINRLQAIVRYTFLSANLHALLALSLAYAHKFISDDQNDLMISKVFANINCFADVQYAPKVLITAFTELLMYNGSAPFVSRKFTQILDLTVSMLEFTSKKKSGYFAKEEEDDEIEYANSLILLKNDMKSMDEFSFFKQKIEILKQNNRDALINSISQFPETKKEFFTNILTIEKVANVPRKIFKIKR